jgi:hypothetical protein
MGKLLDSDEMRKALEFFANEIKARAEVIAPVDTHSGHPGRYKDSFHVRSHLHGGEKHDRAEAVVYNDAPEAIYVEFAHWGAEPEHILARAAYVPMVR